VLEPSKLGVYHGYHSLDIDRLYELETLCFDEAFRWSREDLVAALETGDIWTGVYDHAIVGYVLCEVDLNLHRAHIVSLNVDPQYRHKGIAIALMTAAEAHYRNRGVTHICLEVHVDNPAQILYFKLGYRVDGFLERYYADNSNAIGMSKSLTI
jgi:ribosomal-protein-alanine N-acetyltransferase